MSDLNYGDNLRLARNHVGLSQQKMADVLKISQSKYSRLERHSNIHDARLVPKIERALGVEPLQLVTKMEHLEEGTMRTISGSGLHAYVEGFLHSPLGILLVIGLSIPVVTVAYIAMMGFCSGLGTSEITMNILSWSAVFATTWIIYYLVKNFGKLRFW